MTTKTKGTRRSEEEEEETKTITHKKRIVTRKTKKKKKKQWERKRDGTPTPCGELLKNFANKCHSQKADGKW